MKKLTYIKRNNRREKILQLCTLQKVHIYKIYRTSKIKKM